MSGTYVYADNAATTRVSQRALAAAMPFFRESFGNPSSIHSRGAACASAVLKARQQVQLALGADKVGEIYFTSGGTESDNWAIRGAAEMGERSGRRHIITSAFEHHAVLNTCAYLERKGFEITYLPVGKEGLISPGQVEKALREDTCLVSIMAANNEIGTVQPIGDIGSLCRERGVLFHTDAVQAVGNMPINVEKMNIDLLSLSGHKLHAPKGVGALYCRRSIDLPSLIFGGGQERGRRAGTENVPAIAALGEAITEICEGMEEKNARVGEMRDRLMEGLLKIKGTYVNGSMEKRLPGNLNITFKGVEGESLVLTLDMKGIAASTGAACTGGSVNASHVLTAIGLDPADARSTLRISLNGENTDDDIGYMLSVIPGVIDRLRELSPLWYEDEK